MKRRGVALASAMLALTILSMLVWVFVNVTHQAWFASRRMTDGLRAFYAAEGGIRYVLGQVALGGNWQTRRQLTLQVGESLVYVRTGGLAITSTGVYKGATRTVTLQLSADGAVLSRSEQ